VLRAAGDCVGAFARENTLEQAAIGRRQAPVIACYDFSKPMVCLEIPGNNRRDFFCAFAARRSCRADGREIRRAKKP
jgi:hypothetical protein